MGDQARTPLLGPEDEDDDSRKVAEQLVSVSVDGYLKKRNRWGFWQKRFFVLDGVDLKYYSNKQKKNPRPQLRVVSAVLNGRFGEFDVETETKDLELRAENLRDAELWVQQIEKAEAIEEKRRENITIRAPLLGTPNIPQPILQDIEGYLEMPSGIRFKPWQDRFFRIRNTSLFYYKNNNKEVDDYEGEIPLIEPPSRTSVELTDTSNGRGFAIRVGIKEYKFKAPTADSAKDWVGVLQKRLLTAAKQDRDDVEEKSELPANLNMVPKWIQEWDAETVEAHLNRIQRHLDMLFPRRDDPEYKKKTLNAVTVLLEELDDKARECLPENGISGGLTVTHRESRPDIFEYILRFFHIRIVDELSQFVADQTYNNLTVRELLRFMDLITAYDAKIKEMLQGEVGEQILASLPRFDLLDNAENMAVRYSQVCQGQINAWADRVTFESILNGESRVFVRLDGRYQTPGPTDIFNLLDQALQLGQVSGVKRLQSEIVSMCAVALGSYVIDVTNDLVKTKSDSLPLACAVANDCWSILEHVGKLESENKNEAYRIDFEPVRERCARSADRCLEVLSAMVISDLRPTLDQLFTREHLESVLDSEDAIAVVCATMDDYLEDFYVLLENPFVFRAARMLVRDIVGAYLARLAHAYSNDHRIALSRREVNLVKLDRNRFVACLQGRFPKLDIPHFFGPDLMPLDDVLEMLTIAPSLIPENAVQILRRDVTLAPFLRKYIINTAKMCVDLSVNGTGGNDRLVQEIKALVVTKVEEAVAEPKSATLPEDRVETFERMAFVKMWPMLTKYAAKKSTDKAANPKVTLKEETKITAMSIPQEQKKALQRGNSSHWQNFARAGEAKPVPIVEVNGPPVIILAPIMSGMLRYRGDAKAKDHVEYFCAVRPISETHQTDFEFVVFKGKSESNPLVSRVRISDIARVSYWDDVGAKHFGSDGKVVEDVVPLGIVSGKNAVDYAVAKNASEFVIVSKNGDKVHLIADSPDKARNWVTKIRDTVEDSFEKWGISFVEGQQEYSKLSVSQLKELGKKRGLDLRGCVEKLDMIRVLKNGAPLLNQPKEVDAKPSTTASTTPPPPTPVPPKSPAALDPHLTLNGSMFSTKTAAPVTVSTKTAAPVVAATAAAATVSAAPAAAPAPAKDAPKIKETASMPVISTTTASKPLERKDPQPVTTGKNTEPLLSVRKPAEPLNKPASSAVNGSNSTAPLRTAQSVPNLPSTTTPARQPIAASSATPVPMPAGLNSGEEQLLEVQNLIMRGHLLLEEGDPGQAGRIFKNAKDTAKMLRNPQLEAKASAGLATAYRDQPNMQRAAGPLFEVAAHSFGLTGDSSDRLTCLQDAVDVYLRIGNKTDALRVMESYEKHRKPGSAPVFEQRIRDLKASLQG